MVAHTDLEPAEYAFLHGEGVTEVHADFSVLLEDVVREHVVSGSPLRLNLEAVWVGIETLPSLDRG